MDTVKAGVFGGGAAILAVVALAAVLLRPSEKRGGEGAGGQAADNAVSGSLSPASQSAPPPAPPTKDQKPTAENALTLLGTLLPDEQAALSVRQPSRIVAVLVKDGQTVRKGQLLVQFDAGDVVPQQRSAQANILAAQTQVDKAQAGRQAQIVKADQDIATAQAGVMQARGELGQAQLGVQAAQSQDRADLEAAQTGVHKAELALQAAQKQLHSLEELNTVGGVSRNELEGARTQVEVARADLATAQAGVRRVQTGPNGQTGVSFRMASAQQKAAQAQMGVTQAETGLAAAKKGRTPILAVAQADIRGANAGVAQARAGLAGAQVGQQATRLISPINGVASGVAARTGEVAQPGMPLVSVVSTQGARVEALVAARLLPRLHVGQAARVILDTRPDQSIPATLSAIASAAEPDGRTFRVTFHFNAPPRSLRVGQNARITLL